MQKGVYQRVMPWNLCSINNADTDVAVLRELHGEDGVQDDAGGEGGGEDGGMDLQGGL